MDTTPEHKEQTLEERVARLEEQVYKRSNENSEIIKRQIEDGIKALIMKSSSRAKRITNY